ncbi:glycosyltransferase family 2 protein [Flavobacterium sp. C4GT6]|uniref:glycosyltransferase family 2 protein n=1 Tax=Flavobacterium sp. C4GT6 TaxID=3103818 RepID=UPI002ED3D092
MTGCIVLYNNEKKILLDCISSFINSEIISKLYLIDNSPTYKLRNISNDPRIEYIHNPSNPGFGAAHNMAINKSINEGVDFHFVINPDVSFDSNVIQEMVNYMKLNEDVGMMMPQILNFDGTVQNLPKLLPTPFSILMRKLKRPKFIYDSFINRYELRNVPEDLIYEAPILSGCFTLFNLKALKKVGGYDDKFFMYFEDWDLSRRMNKSFKTVYFPKVFVYHGYESGANKHRLLFKIFIKSAIYYFNKWGWFFDKERELVNKKTLNQFK